MAAKDPDAFFEGIKTNPILKLLYKLPLADRAYHLLLALAGALRFGFPSRRLKVIGVTGTKGKTSTTELAASILEASGKKVALLSSVSIKIGSEVSKNTKGNSMPGRMFIQHFLRKAADAGCEFAVLEVTSQGVLLSRHRFIRWAAAAITNIAPEHIEAHGSFENYRASKLAFLKQAARQGAPVFVNADDEPSKFFADNLPAKNVNFYSTKDIRALPEKVNEVLPGEFSRQNIALTMAIGRKMGLTEELMWGTLQKFQGVPGRAEFIQRKPFAVVVDYAHTADSLKAIYRAVKEGLSGKMIAVLGAAGGGRDKWKRPEMGRVAAENAAEIILTDEDPYDEDPREILSQISKGFFPNTVYSEILDRREAIREAIRRASPGDAVVITGKGSEQYIHLADGKVMEWSDRLAVEEALGNKG